MINHELPLTGLKGVGPKLLGKLEQLGIYSLTDLLLHLPFRYEDHTRLTSAADMIPGEFIVIFGQVSSSQALRKGGLIAQLVTEQSKSEIAICFFKAFGRVRSVFAQGQWVLCAGILRENNFGYELVHPEWKSANNGQLPVLETHLRPVYRSCEGLAQASLRRIMDQALMLLQQGHIHCSSLYSSYSEKLSICLPDLVDAILYLHRPDGHCDKKALEQRYHPAWQALLVDELLTHQLSLYHARCELDQQQAQTIAYCKQQEQQFLENLPFNLTQAQSRVSQEIYDDLARSRPMQRLVQGDVGAGKTVVAALAALAAVKYGQVAVLAPLEVLATQHYQTLQCWLTPFGISTVLLSGRLKKQAREQVLRDIKSGESQVIVGTHALLQNDVQYASLNLVIIDEQHRFGVEQRSLLSQQASKKGKMPHQLFMTATPIPRTLAMTLYADLDVSLLDEVPKGRRPIKTIALANQRRHEVIARVRENCMNGQQAYWVCTLIEASENSASLESSRLPGQAAQALKKILDKELPGLNVGLVHGRLSGNEKNQLLTDFKEHKLDVLVATTVIEVGVDVPNASLMVIENPERLGLAQLHQLRGRVGRGSVQSYCVLMYQAPLSEQGYQRLDVLRESSDGFYIAEQDLLLRGPGDLLGARQTGDLAFRFVDLSRDDYLVRFIKSHDIDFLNLIKEEELRAAKERWLSRKSDAALM
ncbi:ATP-dependent DNA helicase RecG [Piscirickettsia salmonis]|uniref:ATP-dependent DNA helicase RecG n=1 Tax=Piscirickettsia salmonis TaxID=1238 RepID=UPI0002ED1A77|nr:ATP-dependent DNA helicase RecG [Piscirickettsia salmonis]APS56685.1 ATP-dependent DNA helicase RecG [Piscirickettsia salmonis]ERL62535.1 ATP-dependent DNA helicase RecG [Piscirickettsia salmonis LF-89 = ATCC VR-1361]PEQ16106.1 DNA helicase RecG [Piscirickettsia salmonis]QGN78032.1 ATP-dependent DNA helicase RecG [Piscirickettsia salmonis]QGN81614.1 ATP-dependent DNA helicase RecG [Piscirickettsia salmonis]